MKMKKTLVFIVLLALVFTACQQGKIDYPEAKKVGQADIYFGTKVKDPYRWLENTESQETREWIEAQNKLTGEYMAKIPFREKIHARLEELSKYTKYSNPVKKGPYYFFEKKEGLQDQYVLYILKNLESGPEAIIDPNKLSQEGPVALQRYAVSNNGKYIAYSIARSGSDWNEIFIKNIETGEVLDDHVQWVKFSNIAWKNNGFYYSRYEAPGKGGKKVAQNQFQKVYYHCVGTSQEKDQLIFQNKEYPKRNYWAFLSSDKKYLFISESETTSGNALYIKNTLKEDDFTKLTTSFEYEYHVIDQLNDFLFIHTNYKAPKYKVIRINVNSLDIGNWKDVIPEKNIVLENCILADNKLITSYLDDAHGKLEVYDLNGRFQKEIELPSLGTVQNISGTRDDKTAFYSFESFTTPLTSYMLDMENLESEEFFKTSIPIETNKYVTEQVFYKSKEGIDIPMFIVYKKGIKKDGKNPALLYGYGGFNVSIMPSFSPYRFVLLENGGIYASANIRGGGEYGEMWHKAGKGYNKQNVFDDFIRAGEYLIENNYTSTKRLGIYGGSNGGLLVGAVINQRPDLFKVAIPAVGVMDMLRFHKFTIGWAWVGDYGSSEDSSQFYNLYNYSPLHNIDEDNNYPATLVLTADHDDRVVPLHSYKYIATLQEKYDGPNPTLIRIQTKAGHGAGKPTSLKIDEMADLYSFLFYNMNFEPKY